MAQKSKTGSTKRASKSSNTVKSSNSSKGTFVTNKGTKRSTSTTTGSGGPRKK